MSKFSKIFGWNRKAKKEILLSEYVANDLSCKINSLQGIVVMLDDPEYIFGGRPCDFSKPFDEVVGFGELDDAWAVELAPDSGFNARQLDDCNARLKILQLAAKNSNSKEIFDEIRQTILQIKLLLSLQLYKVKATIKQLNSKLYQFRRNIKLSFFQIIQFLFKNMDDESHSNNVVYAMNNITRSNSNILKHGIKKGNNRITGFSNTF